MKTEILAKAVGDSDFRARLIADPKAVGSAETGVEIPEWYNIEVHEDTTTAAHLILPPRLSLRWPIRQLSQATPMPEFRGLG